MTALLPVTPPRVPSGAARAPFVRTPGHAAPLRAVMVLAIAVTVGGGSNSAAAQQPAPTPATALAPYRPPTLALVEPATGVAVPQDRPTVVFRFAPGDSTDPVDARSFAVSVDGKDRTSLFQLARDEAWGPLLPAQELSSLVPGAHTVEARICSIRGACGEVAASVTVGAAPAGAEIPAVSRKRSLMDLLVEAVKKLLAP